MCSCASNKTVKKPRVVMPAYPANASLSLDASQRELGILTYNIKAIGAKEKEETDAFIKYVKKEDFSVLLLQEVLSEKTRLYLIDSLSSDYPRIVDRVDYSSFWRSICDDAGLMVLSKYPLVDIKDVDFSESIENRESFFHQMLPKEVSISFDFMANKSIVGVLLELPDNHHMLTYTTHVQAFGSPDHKREQYELIYKFINKTTNQLAKSGKINPSKTVVILTGDFNSNAYSKNRNKSLLEALNGPIDLHKKYNEDVEEYSFNAGIFNRLFRFDYIFNYDKVGEQQMLPIKIKSAKVTDVKLGDKSISDHLPVVSVIEY